MKEIKLKTLDDIEKITIKKGKRIIEYVSVEELRKSVNGWLEYFKLEPIYNADAFIERYYNIKRK